MSTTIDLSDSAAILVYGMEEQKRISALSERILSYLKVQEKNDISIHLHTAVEYLQDISGIRASHSSATRTPGKSLREKYREAEKNVEHITLLLQQQQIQLMKDSAIYEQLYHMNDAYYHDLKNKIDEAKKMLIHFEQTELPALEKHAPNAGRVQDAQIAADRKGQLEQLSKRISRLELSGSIALQSAPLLKQLQANQIAMAEKIQSILFYHIPLWKDQLFISLRKEHSKLWSKENATDTASLANTNQLLLESLDAVATAQEQELLFKYNVQQELTKQLQII